ncbi:MAG: Crossover junction endodeoxyribonuclease RuvC [Planctomycetota bacterium]|jgi:crossover junction endodeoxyribonuclease RuvC
MATFTGKDLTLRPVAAVRILGIDPGTQVVGYGCLEVDSSPQRRSVAERPLALRTSNTVLAGAGGSGARLVAVGVLKLGARGCDIGKRLHSLADQFRGLVAELQPTEVALEEAFYGKSVQAALRIGEARGVVLAEASRVGVPVHQFAPARIKRVVTGRGAATKESVAAMMEQLLRGLGPLRADLPLDATDALAVAWARLEQRRSPLLGLTGES